MSKKEESGKRSWFNMLGLTLLILSYAVSLYHQYSVKLETFSDDKAVIRVVHWQLESGVREAFDKMAREFENDYKAETGKEVRIVQIPINERAYRQYVTTQCIGGTAPDLIEMGNMEAAHVAKFFIPLTNYIFEKNPYNRETDQEKTPWKDTFFDGLSGSFDQLSLEYYGVGLSCFTVRLFYNMDIFKQALGHDREPQTLDEFIDYCEKLQEWAKKTGKTSFVPVAAANYQIGMMRGRLENSVIMDFMLAQDVDYDGELYDLEKLVGYCSGSYDFDAPGIKAGQNIMYRMTKYFAPGFMQMGRMEAGFQFAQQNAAFITSGSWDAYSFIQQSDFPIGICDFPLPKKDTADIGYLVKGGITESGLKTGFNFGLTRFSENPDVAIRFLQYMTTRKNNERFNRYCKWLPVIRGAEPHPMIKKFEPIMDGFWGTDPIPSGARSRMVLSQYLWDYLEHKTSYENYVKELEHNIPSAQATDYERTVNFLREDSKNQGMKASCYLARSVFSDDEDKPAAKKLSYIWEARMGRYVSLTKWPLEWQRLVDQKMPRALKVDERILNK